jgi:hypothetical protein
MTNCLDVPLNDVVHVHAILLRVHCRAPRCVKFPPNVGFCRVMPVDAQGSSEALYATAEEP